MPAHPPLSTLADATVASSGTCHCYPEWHNFHVYGAISHDLSQGWRKFNMGRFAINLNGWQLAKMKKSIPDMSRHEIYVTAILSGIISMCMGLFRMTSAKGGGSLTWVALQ